MSKIDRLYKATNICLKKSINIEDKLYMKLKELITKEYDATISDIINVCVEDYVEKNKPTYYEKPKKETVTYRSIMIRTENLNALKAMQRKTGISVTRLINTAIKEFINNK